MAHVEEARSPLKEQYRGAYRTIDLSNVTIQGVIVQPHWNTSNTSQHVIIPEGTIVTIPDRYPIASMSITPEIDDSTILELLGAAEIIQFSADIQIDITSEHEEPTLTMSDPAATWLLEQFYKHHHQFILVFDDLTNGSPTVTVDGSPLEFDHEPIAPGARFLLPAFA